jgi:hypothetical protein
MAMARQRWQADLNNASNAHEVVAIARDFLAWLSRSERAMVPLRYRPEAVDSVDDIHDAAGRLVLARNEIRPGPLLDIVAEMADFFIAAQQRLRTGALERHIR